MRCEHCTRKIGRSEIVTGIRFGVTDESTDIFLPDKSSAATVVCSRCGEMLLKMIYTKLSNPFKQNQPEYLY